MPLIALAALNLIKNLPWRLIAIGALAAVLVWSGWTANGWRLSAKLDKLSAAHALALEKSSEDARKKEQDWTARFAAVDAEWTAKLRMAEDEITRRRAAVDTGAVRLRVAARCPAAPDLPGPAAGPGLDHGAAPELDADARPAYFALSSGLTLQRDQLMACQSALAAERKDQPP